MAVLKILLCLFLLCRVGYAVGSPRYDQVTWLCTHNAMNTSDDGWRVPNQTHSITKQLNQGVRALMLDIWKQDGELVLRHGPELARFLGYKKLSIELANIHEFLSKNPESIITLILESYAPAGEVAKAITDAKLAKFCHFQDPTKPWPRLNTMRERGKRLIILSDRVERGSKAPPWYMPVWNHAWETNWQAKSTDELLKASPRRGKRANQLFILNHFITNGLPSIHDSKKANTNPFLKRRVDLAMKTFQRKPNFIVLDFYHVGDGMALVKTMNKKAQQTKIPQP